MPSQAHLCSSVGMYQLQPWYVPGGSHLCMNLCASKYTNFPCTHGSKPAIFTCTRSLRCRCIITRSDCFDIYFPVIACLCCVCVVNLFVKAKRTLPMYTFELKRTAPSFVSRLKWWHTCSTEGPRTVWFAVKSQKKAFIPRTLILQRWV